MKKCTFCDEVLVRRVGEYSGNWKNRKFCDLVCYRQWQKLNPNSGTFKVGNPAPKTAFQKGFTPHNKGKESPWFKGNNNINWKGGRIEDLGYVLLLSPNHPNKDSKGYVREHRLVVESYINRFLTKEECVHHINGDKRDNRIENLYLFPSSSKHCEYHTNLRYGNVERITCSNLLQASYSCELHLTPQLPLLL